MIDLPVHTVLLFCIFLLCCTGAAEKACRLTGVSMGGVAALSLLVAALSGCGFAVSAHINAQPAVLLVAACGVLLNLSGRFPLGALLSAGLCGAAAWALRCAFPALYEPSALLALPATLAGRFLLRGRRRGLLCVLLAPLFYGLLVTFEDWYLFDFVRFSFGSALQLDMQVCGTVFYALLLSVRKGIKAPRAGEFARRWNTGKSQE